MWYYWIALILFIALIIRARIKKKGYFWEDKQGNKLSFREFTKRWKQGIEGITPLQQTKTQLMGMWITITGIFAGIVVNAFVRLTGVWWWLEIILIGSLIVTGVQFIGIYQKYLVQKKIDNAMKEAEYEKNISNRKNKRLVKGRRSKDL